MEMEITLTPEEVTEAVRGWVSDHVLGGTDLSIISIAFPKYQTPCGYIVTVNKTESGKVK